jgi:hypothetical protein
MLVKAFDILRQYGVKKVEDLKQRHIEAGQKAGGEAYEAFKSDIKSEDLSVVLKIMGADYVYYLEHGRGPGKMPPPESLYAGLQSKGLLDQFDKEYKKRGFVFAVGRKIAQEGSYLWRNGQTQTGISSPVWGAFFEGELEQLKNSLSKVIGMDVKSEIVEQWQTSE